MDVRTPQHDTTVGRVEMPPIMFNPAQHRSLAGTLTGAYVAQANSARRRLYGPTLLGSPARRGHSPKMADIFTTARSSIATGTKLAIRVTHPSLISSAPALHLRPASALNQNAALPTTPDQTNEGVLLYPASPPEGNDTPMAKPARTPSQPIHGLENGWQAYQSNRFYAQFQTHHERKRLSPAPCSPNHSFFNKPPQISHAQIVPMNEIETMDPQEDLSSSSASWTGDSQFYIPQHRMLVLPPQERKSSVPDWLEQLPAKPDEFEQEDEYDDEEIAPLSPDVEIERGSMRTKLKKRNVLKRCLSFDEAKMFAKWKHEV